MVAILLKSEVKERAIDNWKDYPKHVSLLMILNLEVVIKFRCGLLAFYMESFLL